MKSATDQPARWRWALGAVAAALIVAFSACEALGWPFLAAPMQRWLGQTLQRRVSFQANPTANAEVRIHLLGGIELQAASIEIGAPEWSHAPHMLLARDATMKLGYTDLWRASRGEVLRIRELRARQVDGEIERLADGRASWQFGKKTETPDTAPAPTRVPVFGRLQVDSGSMRYRDALAAVDLDATYALVDGTNISAAGVQPSGSATGLVFNATGTYRKQPLRINLETSGVLPVIAADSASLALPVQLDARIGGATVTFKGTATDAVHLTALKGRFSVQGPSLAAIGDPLHVTLPTTPAFRAQGLLVKEGVVWKTVIDSATIGASRLGGAFTYDPRGARPTLAGRLTGTKMLLGDLGPAVGAEAGAASGGRRGSARIATPIASPGRPGRVLPDREFDLPALRAMNANVLVSIDNVDLGSSFLAPLQPLRTHLVLLDGVLTLRDVDARTAQGTLLGSVQLDGRTDVASWDADLRWSGVQLENWVQQKRAGGAPAFATGNLSGQARLAGQGRSTASILGSLRGQIRMHIGNGTISHLVVEAAGLDVAQALGVYFKGDDALPLACNVVDLVVERGQVTPRALVLDTRDSTIVVGGSLSLATEALDLRIVTSPKDISPLALRAPIEVHGTFGAPRISVVKAPLVERLGAAGLLALINPLAALIPLVDLGDKGEAQKGDQACQRLSQRMAAAAGRPLPGKSGSVAPIVR